jgi:hypothetical protein
LYGGICRVDFRQSRHSFNSFPLDSSNIQT